MKNVSHLLLAALLSSLLASCASRTMDSVPSLAELNAYEQVMRAKYQGLYNDLEKRRASGVISKTQYDEDKHRLDAKVAAAVNDAAWNKHFLAESERKSDGVPTPDQPVVLAAGQVGGMMSGSVGSGGMGSFYRPSYMNYGAVAGMGGTAGMSGSMRSANDQIGKGQSIRNDAISAGGSYLSTPPPGSVYDNEPQR
ncbi:hypothetical protein [Prosthecobacter vanneervenii]|uniref:Lipoprotein n=1 Tax=Prosthecobacter vanneervenii TaxID=48466 RepID=A0A7W7YDG4_9BACT|nr:hypothetical protein [Prosthecobacter vanneervenii]MBB5033810.1 hypothetical protein [Prosthecobacter vanneervenii]